jgi:hypothetical protein
MKPARSARPIALSPETIAKCDGPEQFETFDRMFRTVIAVPKTAVEKAETRWKRPRRCAPRTA